MEKFKKIKDPFGDFDFIFSAAFSGQKILNILYITKVEHMAKLKYLDLEMVGSCCSTLFHLL